MIRNRRKLRKDPWLLEDSKLPPPSSAEKPAAEEKRITFAVMEWLHEELSRPGLLSFGKTSCSLTLEKRARSGGVLRKISLEQFQTLLATVSESPQEPIMLLMLPNEYDLVS